MYPVTYSSFQQMQGEMTIEILLLLSNSHDFILVYFPMITIRCDEGLAVPLEGQLPRLRAYSLTCCITIIRTANHITESFQWSVSLLFSSPVCIAAS